MKNHESQSLSFDSALGGKGFASFIFAIVLSLIVVPVTYGAGEPDTSFSASAYGTENGQIYVVKKQADGKILVGGYFTMVSGVAATGITRFNTDGTIDSTFSVSNLFASFGFYGQVNSIAVQSDGKIIVGGYFASPTTEFGLTALKRINADGSIDNTFATQPFFGNFIYDIEIQADNKIVIGGDFVGPQNTTNLARFNADGSVDTSFSTLPSITVKDLAIQPDGKIVVTGHPNGSTNSQGVVKRLLTNGTNDSTFTEPSLSIGRVEAILVRPDGKLLFGGYFSTVNGFNVGKIGLLNSNGSIDLTFNQNNPGTESGTGNGVNDIELRADGKIVIGGRFLTFNGVSRKSIARLNADGTLDTTFQDNNAFIGDTHVYDLELLSGNEVVSGAFYSGSPFVFRKFGNTGVSDPGFSQFLTLSGRVSKIVAEANGKILIGGSFPYANGIKRNSLARLNTDGSLDTGFVPFFVNEVLQRTITAIAVQSDGKILVGRASVDQTFRMNPDGTLDGSFNTPFFGTVKAIAPLSGGQVIVGGSTFLKRLNSNGTNDAAFAVTVSGIEKIFVQTDGKILVAGTFATINGTGRGRIARLNADGTIDTTFNPPGGANNTVLDFAVQPDGKIILGGDFTNVNGSPHLRIARLNADGSVDDTFIQNVDGTVRSIKIQSNGKVLIAGSMGYVQSQQHTGIARLNSNGSLDTTFVTAPNAGVYALDLQTDDKVLIGGDFILVNGVSAVRIARLQNTVVTQRTLFDYNGDGRADVSVFRGSSSRWYQFLSGSSGVFEQTFGTSGDLPVPGDYDGDGKTDVAIFRPSSGDWWYFSSLNGTPQTTHWGAAGDIPRPSDFDGDGKTDFIVYRPSESIWYRLGSADGFSALSFGSPGDKPVIGDFDGDGKSDVAIFRPSTGVWWWKSNTETFFRATQWGISTDIPVPADYDGDGKTDFAVYRASEGNWYILNSGNGQSSVIRFGLSEDKPVAADYDGDGKADVAVFRPSSGIWYILGSTVGFSGIYFGNSTDTPTPNVYVP